MALAVFTGLTPVSPYRVIPRSKTVTVEYEGSGGEQRYSPMGRDYWDHAISFLLTDANLGVLFDFFIARRMHNESFLWKPLKAIEHARTAIPLTPNSDGSTTVFALPATGQYAGDYPIDDANVRIYRAGVLVGGTHTAQTDARTVTSSVAPAGGGAAMTADYHRYLRVRLAGGLEALERVFTANEVGSLMLAETNT